MNLENSDIVTLMDSLEELSEELVRKGEEIKAIQNELQIKIAEASELKANLSTLQTQFEQTREDLKNTKDNFEDLESKQHDFALNLAKKDEDLNRTLNQLETQTNEVQLKTQEISDERSKRDAWELENRMLRKELSSMKNKLNNVDRQLQVEKTKRVKINCKWEFKYRKLQQECFAYQNELESYNYHADMENTYQTYQPQQTFTDPIHYTRGYNGVNTRYYRGRKK